MIETHLVTRHVLELLRDEIEPAMAAAGRWAEAMAVGTSPGLGLSN